MAACMAARFVGDDRSRFRAPVSPLVAAAMASLTSVSTVDEGDGTVALVG
jgi:hypothetical protein